MVLAHGNFRVVVHEARDVKASRGFRGNDCYVIVKLDKVQYMKTSVKELEETTEWEYSRQELIGMECESIKFSVEDNRRVNSQTLGQAEIAMAEIVENGQFSDWIPLDDEGSLRVTVELERLPPAHGMEVPQSYYSPRQGCNLTLYADAEVDPDIDYGQFSLPDGSMFRPQRCWVDLFEAIENARCFIYVMGWSVNTEIRLVRGETQSPTLGEILLRKAEEGVRVNVMPWDETTSLENEALARFLSLENGVMCTYDEATQRYFEGTPVNCYPVARKLDKTAKKLFGSMAWSVVFTHHMKAVILDAACPHDSDRGRVVAFMGGIDLTSGRYDTGRHSIFRTLQGVHKDDFYQGNYPQATVETGPREPWHDIHCRVEGRAARDVLDTFTTRWMKQNADQINCLLDLESLGIVSPDEEDCGRGEREWNAQVFRSLDSGVAVFKPGTRGVIEVKSRLVDQGIQNAYVHHIRRAQHHIYIENQYFLGSSLGWEEPKPGCENMIPAEIALKIVSKIHAGERFTAYILIPMHPEGHPASGSVQEILCWQSQTIKMMYSMIGNALREVGSDDSPTDYLAFFCLGNRELPDGGQEMEEPSGSSELKAQQMRHGMIYVHAKMMIVDDDFIIVGSANINERSMAGSRDSEMCIGAWQPSCLANRSGTPEGDVAAFRRQLWTEHIGIWEECFTRPSELETIREVIRIAGDQWRQYNLEEDFEIRGHLMNYPINVGKDGSVTALEGYETFPDFPPEALVLGSCKSDMPNLLTF